MNMTRRTMSITNYLTHVPYLVHLGRVTSHNDGEYLYLSCPGMGGAYATISTRNHTQVWEPPGWASIPKRHPWSPS